MGKIENLEKRVTILEKILVTHTHRYNSNQSGIDAHTYRADIQQKCVSEENKQDAKK